MVILLLLPVGQYKPQRIRVYWHIFHDSQHSEPLCLSLIELIVIYSACCLYDFDVNFKHLPLLIKADVWWEMGHNGTGGQFVTGETHKEDKQTFILTTGHF